MTSNVSSSGNEKESAKSGKARTSRASSSRGSKRGYSSPARHDVRMAVSAVVPCALVFLVYFTVCMGVSTAAIPDMSIFSLDFTHDQLKFRFWADAMTYPVVIGSVVFGAVMAFASFRYLLIKMQATTYLSLPLTRDRQYLTRAVVCALVMLVVLTIALGVSLALNLAALGPWEGEFVQFGYILAGLFTCTLVGFSVMAVALMLAGTQLEAALFAAALLACVTVACWGMNVITDALLVGNAAGEHLINTQHVVEAPLLAAYAACNPLLFFVEAAATHQTFMVMHPVYAPASPDWLLPAAWLVFSLALIFVGHMLYVSRHGEKAGMAGLCTPMSFVFGLVCGVAVFAVVFQALAGVNQVVAIVAGLAVFIIVSFLLLRGPLRGETSTLRQACGVLAGETAVLGAVVAIVATGGLGWSGVVPADEDIASVQVSYTGSPVWLVRNFDSATASNNSYYASGTYTYTSPSDISTVTGAHRALVQTGHAPYATDKVNFGQTVVPYDVVFSYTMKDGATLTRYYDRATLDELSSLLVLDDSKALSALRALAVSGESSDLDPDVASAISSSMTAQAFANGDIYLANALMEDPLLLSCTPEARTELLHALAADVAAQGSQNRYYPKKLCLGVLMFSMDGANDSESFSYQMENSVIYLTAKYEKTLAWLDKVGLKETLASSAKDVKKMSFERYDPYAGMNDATGAPRGQVFMSYLSATSDDFIAAPDFGKRFETDDEKQIKELFGLMRATYFMNGGGYQVCCELKNGKNAYFFIPYADAPDWLIRQVG